MFQAPTLEKASVDFDLRQSTMVATSAARTALCSRFGFSETGLLASVGAGEPSVQRFIRRSCFQDAAAAWLDSATRAVTIVLVAAIAIAVGDADGRDEGIFY